MKKSNTDWMDARSKRNIARNKRAVSRARLSRVDWPLFTKRAARIITFKQADLLSFHLMELDEVCAVFRMKIRRLYRALAGASPDSPDLDDTDGEVWSELLHLQYHVRGALRPADKLFMKRVDLEERKSGARAGARGRRNSPRKPSKSDISEAEAVRQASELASLIAGHVSKIQSKPSGSGKSRKKSKKSKKRT